MPLEDLERAYPRAYERLIAYPSFVFVRNPFARTRSAFAEWCVRTHRKRNLADAGWAVGAFRDYVAALDAEKVRRSPTWIHACPQHLFAYNRDVQVSRWIGRTETIAADLEAISGGLGVPLQGEVRRHNDSGKRLAGGKGPDSSASAWYDAFTERRVARFYAADFEAFGYERALA